MKKHWIILVVIILLVVGSFVIFSSKEKNKIKNENNKEVKIGYFKLLPATMALMTAKDNGYFDQANIKIKTIEYATANQIVDALIRGDIDLAPYTSVSPVLNAELIDPGKIKLFFLSDITSENRVDAILVKSNSILSNLDQLVNKKIGVFPGNTATGFLKMYLKSKNIDTSKIEFVQLAPTNQLPALESSSIDALFSYEPIITMGLQNYKVKIIDESIEAKVFNHTPLLAGLFATKFVNNNPELAERVANVFKDTYKKIKVNEQLARDSEQKLFNFDKKIADNVVLTYIQDSMDKKAFSDFADLLVSFGELKSKPDLSNIFYK